MNADREVRSPVEAYMAALEHPLKPVIEEVRSLLLEANPDLTENIKWNAPNYRYRDEDRITFQLRGRDFFLLIFHCGAKAKERSGKERLIEDPTGLLEWASADRATIRLTGFEDVAAKRDKLIEVVNRWLEANGVE